MGQLKAHLAWQAEVGTTGIPRDGDLKEKLRANPLPDFSALPHEREPARPTRGTVSENSSSAPFQSPREAGAAASPPPSPPVENAAPDFSPDKRMRPNHLSVIRAPSAAERPDYTGLGATLDEVRVRVSSCTACDLHAERTQTVFSRGTGSSGVCFIGEGPGADEDAQGEPFVGAAGQLLDKMILAMGLSREEVYVCNVVKCRPPNNRRPTPIEMQTCSPFLKRQLELLEPRVIVALGGTAVTGLLGLTEGITRLRGRFRLYEGRIAVMPTFHPAYLLRNPSAKREVWNDLRQVLSHIGRELPAKS